MTALEDLTNLYNMHALTASEAKAYRLLAKLAGIKKQSRNHPQALLEHLARLASRNPAVKGFLNQGLHTAGIKRRSLATMILSERLADGILPKQSAELLNRLIYGFTANEKWALLFRPYYFGYGSIKRARILSLGHVTIQEAGAVYRTVCDGIENLE